MFIVVDWGTSRLRLYALAESGGDCLAEVSSSRGIATLSRGQHEGVFLEALRELLEPVALDDGKAGLDVYFSGMITSDLGWRPTPYVKTPLGFTEILDAAHRETLPAGEDTGGIELRLHFFPGMRTDEDIARGEEVEALGLLNGPAEIWDSSRRPADGEEGVLVLPGTHSKWIRFRDGRLLDFLTVPTGDLHAALHRDSLLARTLPDSPVRITGELEESFDLGLEAVRRRGPLASLFLARSLCVLPDRGLNPEQSSAYLSGVLVGGEMSELSSHAGGAPVYLGGSADLQELYSRACGQTEGLGPVIRARPGWTGRAAALAFHRLRLPVEGPETESR